MVVIVWWVPFPALEIWTKELTYWLLFCLDMAPPSLPRRGSEPGCLQRHHEEANGEN